MLLIGCAFGATEQWDQAFFFSRIPNLACGCFVEIFGSIIALKYNLYVNETKHRKNPMFLVGFEYTICIFDL
jgi:hypothetical protein